MKPISCKQLYFIAYCYCTCSYTTRVVWQTKCELVTCISCVQCRVCLLSHMRMPKSRATVRAHASFLTFACVKRASTCVYLHACVKFKLSCTIASCNCCVVNGMIRLGVKSIMVAHDETSLNLGTTSLHEHEILISNSCNRPYHLDFSTINTYLQPFNFSEIVNI